MPSFLHAGDLGDCIYALPTIKLLGRGMLYLANRGNSREAFTPARYEFIKPLLEAQPYITGCEMHKGQKVTHDFTDFREGFVKNVTLAEIQRRHVASIGPRPDFSRPWIEAGSMKSDSPYIVVARSPRYHNPEWQKVWPTIFDLGKRLIFIGLKEEHAAFQEEFGKIEYMPLPNALHMAELIKGSSMFIGNQSFPFAIAEGLKVNRVLEVCPDALDCLYAGGPDVRHILKASDWPECSSQCNLMIALQCYPDDRAQALELAKIIVAIEGKPRTDIEAAVCVRSDVSEADAAEIEAVLATKFKTITLRCRRDGRGWPEGCNDLWQSSMQQLWRLHTARTIKAEAVLTFEPDVAILRRDWLDSLKKQWIAVKRKGKMAFGTTSSGGNEHLNGNLVIAIDAIKRYPQLQASSGPWDVFHGKLLTTQGIDSPLIVQRYQDRKPVSADELSEIRQRGEVPAFIHGIKHESRFTAMRLHLHG